MKRRKLLLSHTLRRRVQDFTDSYYEDRRLVMLKCDPEEVEAFWKKYNLPEPEVSDAESGPEGRLRAKLASFHCARLGVKCTNAQRAESHAWLLQHGYTHDAPTDE